MENLQETPIRKKVVYQGKYLCVEEHIVRLPDGNEGKREIIRPPDAAAVFPIDQDGNVYLVRQYRTAIHQVTLEIPAGILDPNEKPLDTARRECSEEIGLEPKRLDFLFKYYHSVGFSTGQISVYLGRDLILQKDSHLDSEEFIEKVTLPFEVLYKQARAGEIIDSKTLLAILWYKQHYS